jgi:hypothetical protein
MAVSKGGTHAGHGRIARTASTQTTSTEAKIITLGHRNGFSTGSTSWVVVWVILTLALSSASGRSNCLDVEFN